MNRSFRRWAALLLGICAIGAVQAPALAAERPQWTEERLIAHAMGGINGNASTNTYEAFLVNYEKGFRLFEVDLILSEDEKLVARHDWLEYTAVFLGQTLPEGKAGSPLTVKEFKSAKIMDKYKPMTFGDILTLLQEYPDITIITDTKETEPALIAKQFTSMVEKAASRDITLLNRIVPELYTPEMVDIVQSIYDFPSVIFSIYQSPMSPEEVVRFVDERDISVVAMPVERATEPFIAALNDLGAVTYVHTTNSAEEVRNLQSIGVHGFYTDFLSKKALDRHVTKLKAEPEMQAEPDSDAIAGDPADSNGTAYAAFGLLGMQIVFLLLLRKYRPTGLHS